MSTYRYTAPATPAQNYPDADEIMDQLADHVLEHKSLEQAMANLRKQGVKQKYGDSLDGLNRLASQLRAMRKQILKNHTLEPLLNQLSHEIRSLLTRELEALRSKMSSEQNRLNQETESLLGKAEKILDKLQQIRSGKRRATPQGFGKLERQFEEMFLKKSEIESQSRALREEERERYSLLQHGQGSPSRALRNLAGYKALDPSVGSTLESLSELTDEIGAIERADGQRGFSGSDAVGLDEAIDLVGQMRGIERLETKMRRGFLTPADERRLSKILGANALTCHDAVARLEQELMRAGYLGDCEDGLKLSPRAIRRIGQKALSDIFANLNKSDFGAHQTSLKGAGHPDLTDTRAYGFGDSFNIHVGRTLMNAIKRDASRTPVDIIPKDFEVYDEHHGADCSNVLMLDLSYTMADNGKLQAAKKVTLAFDSLIRTRFARDTLHIIGFATHARELTPEELPHVELSPGNPFTNMQDGFRLAERLIGRDRGRNRQVVLITDGEPTAFCRDGELHVSYPPTQEIFAETMREVARLTRNGIIINTFMLDEQPRLVEFVEKMTEMNKGRAFFSTPQKLGEYLLVDYLSHRRRMIN